MKFDKEHGDLGIRLDIASNQYSEDQLIDYRYSQLYNSDVERYTLNVNTKGKP